MKKLVVAALLASAFAARPAFSQAVPDFAGVREPCFQISLTGGGVCAKGMVNVDLTGLPIGTASNPFTTGTSDTYRAAQTVSAAAGSQYAFTVGGGQSTVAFTIAGLTGTGAVVSATYSDDKGVTTAPLRYMGTATVPGATTITANGMYTFTLGGHTNIYLTVTTAGTGSFTVASNASTATREINIGGAGTDVGNPFFQVGIGGANIATAQVSVGNAATLVVAARTGRQKAIISVSAANACVVGGPAVTAASGFPLPVANQSITLDTMAAVYALCPTATTTVSVAELYK